jgi:ATP-dependent protease Clp ATPase subunit
MPDSPYTVPLAITEAQCTTEVRYTTEAATTLAIAIMETADLTVATATVPLVAVREVATATDHSAEATGVET